MRNRSQRMMAISAIAVLAMTSAPAFAQETVRNSVESPVVLAKPPRSADIIPPQTTLNRGQSAAFAIAFGAVVIGITAIVLLPKPRAERRGDNFHGELARTWINSF